MKNILILTCLCISLNVFAASPKQVADAALHTVKSLVSTTGFEKIESTVRNMRGYQPNIGEGVDSQISRQNSYEVRILEGDAHVFKSQDGANGSDESTLQTENDTSIALAQLILNQPGIIKIIIRKGVRPSVKIINTFENTYEVTVVSKGVLTSVTGLNQVSKFNYAGTIK